MLSTCFTVVSVVDAKPSWTQEEQANLLGELAMLRNHKHSHLVEFIGTAMAVERGSDTVREQSCFHVRVCRGRGIHNHQG